MDFYPENILLEIIALLSAPLPPLGPDEEPGRSVMVFPEFQRIWWLERFLQAEPEAFREQFLVRPAQEQQALAAQIFRWYLYRPRLQRLYPARSDPRFPVRWEVVRGGSLVSLAGEETGGTPSGIYYIFPHSRIWPDLLDRLEWTTFLTAGEKKGLEADLEFGSRSRLFDVRNRSERLRYLLTRPEPDREVNGPPPPEKPGPKAPTSPVKKSGRKKKPTGQLSLFD